MDNESAVNEQQHQLPTADAAAAVNESLISASTTEEPASSSSTQQQQPLVKRKRPSNNNTTIIDLHTFQHSPHSLRISASSVSALCGLHPYQNLPQLFFDLVYQSHLGQLLLQTDASLLGLTIVDAQSHEQNQMLAMASSISNETRQLVQTAINVSNGTTKLQSVEDVQSIQHQIQINALQSGKLTKREVNTLVEASRGNMSTGFGNAHEEDALDLYEKVVGCRVRERNEALMTWKFERVVTKNDNDEERNTKEMGYCGVTARPMGDARRREWGEMMSIVNNNLEKANDGKNDDDDDDDAKPENEKEKEDKGVEVIDLSDDTTTTPSSEQNHHKCFFKIVGAVDGIRDEIYIDKTPPPPPRMSSTDDNNATSDTKSTNIPNSKHNTPSNNKNAPKSNDDEYNFSDDDDNNEQWTVRPIIVECKHRMSQAKVPPPLYDQIQTCLYMNMYKVDDADLIQVVRRNTKRMTTTTTTPAIKKDYDDEGAEGKENDQPMKKANDDTTMTKANNNNNNNGEKKTKEGNHNVQITISRISLNDPIHNHQYHWNETLLPRLASFVDAVYNVRKDDGKRYRLLMALVEEQNGCGHKGDQSNEEAWKILWDEMPWLRLCDTSFGRGRR